MSNETLLTYFQRHIKEHPNRVALRHKDDGIWHDVTWAQYGEKIRQVAMGLISLGLKKGEGVSIVIEMEGLKRYKDPLLMSFDDLLKLGKEFDAKNPGLFEQRWSEVKPDDLAVLIYTSGTTGPPKGAMLTHRNLLFMSEAMVNVNEVYDGDETLSFFPFCHIFEQLFTVMINIRFGTVCNFIESPDTVMDNMKEVSPTVTCGVPRIWEKYASGIMIRMSDATWFKRQVFKVCMAIGMKYASLTLNFKPVPPY